MHPSSITPTLLLLTTVQALTSPLPRPHSHFTNNTNNWQPAFFNQLIDHKDPSRGTFKQRYWLNVDAYGGPGSPIVLQTPTERSVDQRQLTGFKRSLPYLFALSNKAAAIALEHRYWGQSLPMGKDQSTDKMQYLTLDNAIHDVVHFAKTVNLPFDRNGTSKPGKAPWILTGCSYAGALTAWIHALSPGTFWAYHCGSAVVQAMTDLSGYFGTIEKAMPRNCSADMKRVVKHVDQVLDAGGEAKVQLKKQFGFSSNMTDDDFAGAISSAPSTWQSTQFASGYNSFSRMCDYMENQWPGSNYSTPGAEGVGKDRAIVGLAKWMRERFPKLPEVSIKQEEIIPWRWLLCNEPFEWWQIAGPNDGGIVPKALSKESMIRGCKELFPPKGNATLNSSSVEQVNRKTGGWNQSKTKRLLWVNGEFDPWRPATVSAERRPGGPLESTSEAPVWVVPGASHCSELPVMNGRVNEGARVAIQGVVRQMKTWVDEFYQ
ncbi:hypothetical protein CDD80_5860 [Ophiocordyceps camponoti-rufipedis]|uniref:Uncharacterized protein n=1 Tax=Ophiocordyceps camponoti-rufipedis TaxID=2004952 RepID=A0A2C5ZDB1_9HYPO|nr:hypothetical protein CDD80_5860 [Ophiocordyceps camponoti-rufipedis]